MCRCVLGLQVASLQKAEQFLFTKLSRAGSHREQHNAQIFCWSIQYCFIKNAECVCVYASIESLQIGIYFSSRVSLSSTPPLQLSTICLNWSSQELSSINAAVAFNTHTADNEAQTPTHLSACQDLTAGCYVFFLLFQSWKHRPKRLSHGTSVSYAWIASCMSAQIASAGKFTGSFPQSSWDFKVKSNLAIFFFFFFMLGCAQRHLVMRKKSIKIEENTNNAICYP